jgi:hypothetical protein
MKVKYADFKFMATGTKTSISIAYKKKNGLLFMVTDTKFNREAGGGFTFYLGHEFVQVTLQKGTKGFYLELVLPAKETIIKLKLVNRETYIKFCKIN